MGDSEDTLRTWSDPGAALVKALDDLAEAYGEPMLAWAWHRRESRKAKEALRKETSRGE